MYAFPEVKFSRAAKARAEAEGLDLDLYYCLELLKATGIMVVPGSGFKQEPGTHHFRTTILPDEGSLHNVFSSFRHFNEKFHKSYT
jgi:aspartate/methionine/tyrosine aminotransferase